MLRPGEFCHHSAKEPHSTRAPPSEPVLWLYFWCGDIDGDYWFIEQEEVDKAEVLGQGKPLPRQESCIAASNAVRRLSAVSMLRTDSLPLFNVSRRKSVVVSRQSEIWRSRVQSPGRP